MRKRQTLAAGGLPGAERLFENLQATPELAKPPGVLRGAVRTLALPGLVAKGKGPQPAARIVTVTPVSDTVVQSQSHTAVISTASGPR